MVLIAVVLAIAVIVLLVYCWILKLSLEVMIAYVKEYRNIATISEANDFIYNEFKKHLKEHLKCRFKVKRH